MKATDFNLSNDLVLDPSTGTASFKDSRLVIFDANAIGLLRQNLIESLGFEQARKFFLRFGFQHGYSDFMQMKINYEFDSEMDLLASGPVIHTWEGIVHAKPIDLRLDRDKNLFQFTGRWTNSYEAEQHLCHNETSKESVCWSLTGYASGWSTAFYGKPVLALEPLCVGKGDDHCEWKIMPLDQWGPEAKTYRDALLDLLTKGGTNG